MDPSSDLVSSQWGTIQAGSTNERVAITIKTFNRSRVLLKCIDSIFKHCNVPFKLYIADDGPVSTEVEGKYAALIQNGHVVRRYDRHVPVTRARNELVSMMEDEPFVLRLDDDFMFTHETDLAAMMSIMRADDRLGALAGIERQLGDGKGVKSGEISHMQGLLVKQERAMFTVYIPVEQWLWQKVNGYRYSRANVTRNFLLIRRAVFDDVAWNEALAIRGEHIDFMIRLQEAGWGLGFTPDSIHVHDETIEAPEGYRTVRMSASSLAQQKHVYSHSHGFDEIYHVNLQDCMARVRTAKRSLRRRGMAKLKKLMSRSK